MVRNWLSMQAQWKKLWGSQRWIGGSVDMDSPFKFLVAGCIRKKLQLFEIEYEVHLLASGVVE